MLRNMDVVMSCGAAIGVISVGVQTQENFSPEWGRSEPRSDGALLC